MGNYVEPRVALIGIITNYLWQFRSYLIWRFKIYEFFYALHFLYFQYVCIHTSPISAREESHFK